jgi:hypothetical protein
MRLSLLLLTLLLAACSGERSDFGNNPDLSVERATRLAQSEGAGEWTDVQVGSGRVVQPGRKITANFRVSDTAGNVIGTGPIVYVYGVTNDLIDLHYPGTGVPEDVAFMLGGMQVGGKRHFVIPRTECGDTARKTCVVTGPKSVIEYPNSSAVAFDVEVTAVCRPRIAIVTHYMIPKSQYTQAEERSCS